MSEVVMVRVSKDLLDKLRSVTARHPLKPSLRVSVDRAIELMIEDFEEEINNANK